MSFEAQRGYIIGPSFQLIICGMGTEMAPEFTVYSYSKCYPCKLLSVKICQKNSTSLCPIIPLHAEIDSA